MTDYEASKYYDENKKLMMDRMWMLERKYAHLKFDAESMVNEAFVAFCNIYDSSKGAPTTCLWKCLDLIVKRQLYKANRNKRSNISVSIDENFDVAGNTNFLSDIFREEEYYSMWEKVQGCSERAKIIFLIITEAPENIAGESFHLLDKKGTTNYIKRNLMNEMKKWDEFKTGTYEQFIRKPMLELKTVLFGDK